MNNQQIKKQLLQEISLDTNLTMEKSLQCVRSILRSVRHATQQHGDLDLTSMFGVLGMSTLKNHEPQIIEKGNGHVE